jgi:hypothetical protein
MSSNESMLQKDWKNKDVQRMRNLISKNYHDKTTVQTGYSKEIIEHKEGDIWIEKGKEWTIKNGIKCTVSRLNSLKKLIILPLACPHCNKPMKVTPWNKKMWSLHKMCLDCVIEMETRLKRDGKFEEYSRNMIKNGISKYITELEQMLLEIAMESHSETYVNEQGDVEIWKSSSNMKEIQDKLQEYITNVKAISNL